MCTFISVWIYIMLFHYMISALDLLGCVVLVAHSSSSSSSPTPSRAFCKSFLRSCEMLLWETCFLLLCTSFLFLHALFIISERMDALQIEKGLNKKKFHYIFHRYFLHGNLTRWNDNRRTMLELNQCSDGSWEYIKYKLCHFYEFSWAFFSFSISCARCECQRWDHVAQNFRDWWLFI